MGIADEILAQADRLESGFEWVQCTPENDRSACAVEWVDELGFTRALSCDAVEALSSYVTTMLNVGFESVVYWNDHYAENVGEVIDVLKHTAKDLANG